MIESLFGYECVIVQTKKQKKTSKHKIINWLYKKIYGYKYESLLPDGSDVVVFGNKIMFRDEETFNKIKEQIEKQQSREVTKHELK